MKARGNGVEDLHRVEPVRVDPTEVTTLVQQDNNSRKNEMNRNTDATDANLRDMVRWSVGRGSCGALLAS